MKPSPDPPPLEVYLLGLVDFEDVQQLQRRLVYDLGERGGAALVLCEHPPTISVGRSGSRAHILPDDDELRALGIRVHWVNRGGGCVLHLPGQLAAYLALPLEPLGLDLAALPRRAARGDPRRSSTSSTCGARPGPTCRASSSATRGWPSVGVAVNRWIAYHGLTLNVGPFLEPFDLILDEPGTGAVPAPADLDGVAAAAADADGQGPRGADPPARGGLRPGAAPRLHAPPPDPPEGPRPCLRPSPG